MLVRFSSIALVFALTWLGSSSHVVAQSPDPSPLEFFETSVRPVLVQRCQTCHGASKQKGGLRLDSRPGLLKGGETGPAVVPGKPDESLLVEAIRYGEDLQMPPKSKLPAAEVATLTRWVEMGSPWPETPGVTKSTIKPGFDLKARRESHWAWQAVAPRTPPVVNDSAWTRDPIDRFLLVRLDAKHLKPAPDADRRVLIRRLAFDLTGLPSTPEEIEAFLKDKNPEAVERLVDRLLASPRFGERWGRHWLDLVRYAESRGHEFDATIPNAWQYRDYVVRALNADLPYHQFVTEQIAGDLLDHPRLDPITGANESLVATGFWFLGEELHSPVDIRQDETDRMDNRLDVMSKTFLGLTVACARCHDHKFDAISQRDYYALTGFLISSGYRQARFATMERERQVAKALQSLRQTARARILPLAARAIRPEVGRSMGDLYAALALLGRTEKERGTADEPTRRWADELLKAKADPLHPFHAYITVIGDVPTSEEAITDRFNAWADSHEPKPGAERAEILTLVDFAKFPALDRLQDGFSFGLRPAQFNDLILSGTPSAPKLGLVDQAGAWRDPAFRGLKLADVTEHDHGRLGTWERSSQTLRTPEFTIGSGKIWYLARGAGRAYAAVNSHLLIAGPLHGALLTEWTDGQKGWRWVRHDLSAYAGHRAHIEFSPSGPGDLAIVKVVESDRQPPLDHPAERCVYRSTMGLARNGGWMDAPFLTSAYFVTITETLAAMEAGPERLISPQWADWLIRNLDLFAPGESKVRKAFDAEVAKLAAEQDAIARELAMPTIPAPAIFDGSGANEFLLIRGSSKTPGPEVPRRFLEAIAGDAPFSHGTTGSGRLELARQLTSPTNPFASRVIVNRIWHHLFGRGIVASTDNFGVLGELPTNLELLDHLADRFLRDGGSIKHLIKTIVLTRAYQMSSRPDPEADRQDPENKLVHRMSIRRLEAEPLRDTLLAVSGRLDSRIGGPSVPVHLTEFMEGRGRPGKSGPLDGDGRRSLYLAVRRNFLTPMMLTFDAPIPFSAVGRRNVSNVPAQALILMNDPFVIEQARYLASHALSGPDQSPEARIKTLYLTAFGRPPQPDEQTAALDFLDSQARELNAGPNDPRIWSDLAHVLFNSKEFIFID